MKADQCPKCKAALPRRGQFCLDCGLDLYAEGLRHRPVPWFHIIAVPIVAAGVLAALIIGPCKGEGAPEVAAVLAQTRELLRLLADGDHAQVVQRYYRANAERFGAAEERLRQIARGEGAPGLKKAQAHGFRNLDEVLAYVRKHGTRNPECIARLLHAIVSHGEPNPWLSPRRVDRFFEWFLEQQFAGLDVSRADVSAATAGWDEGVLVVNVRYPQTPKPLGGLPDPSAFRWRLITSSWGGCTRHSVMLDYGGEVEDRLSEFLDFLKRLPAE